MNRTIILLLAAVALFTPKCAAQPYVQGNEKPPEISAETEKILKDLSSAYGLSKSLQLTLTTHIHMKQKGEVHDVSQPLHVAFRRPDRLALTREHGEAGLYLNGTTATTVIAQMKQYKAEAQTGSAEQLDSNREVQFIAGPGLDFLRPLLSKDPYPLMLVHVTKAQIVGEEKVNGVLCQKILMLQDPLPINIFVSKEEKPRFVRASPDLAAFIKLHPEGKASLPEDYSINIDFEQQTLGGEIADAEFEAEIPAGTERVEAFGRGGAPEGPHPLLNKPAPALKLSLLDGGSMNLAALKGQVVVLDFWATWCGPCRMAMPNVIKATDAFKGKGVKFFAVDLQEDAGTIRPFLKTQGWNMPVALDSDGAASEPFQFQGIPFTVVIDQQGIVRRVHEGYDPGNGKKLQADLAALLAGKTLK